MILTNLYPYAKSYRQPATTDPYLYPYAQGHTGSLLQKILTNLYPYAQGHTGSLLQKILTNLYPYAQVIQAACYQRF